MIKTICWILYKCWELPQAVITKSVWSSLLNVQKKTTFGYNFLGIISLIYLQAENPEDLYSRPFKQPTVESCNGNSYMISNGSSGFYHTGSRSRLYGTDLEDTIYSTPPKLPPKIDLYCEIPTPKLQVKSDNSALIRREHNSTLTRRESTSRTIASSVYSKCLTYTKLINYLLNCIEHHYTTRSSLIV